MPRDSSGSYSLPAGNPVVSGTTITSIWANTTMSDIADALTNSLSRNGQGGMLAPLKFADGSETQPGIAYVNEPGSGLYRAASNDVRMTIGGSDNARWRLDGGVQKYELWNGTTWGRVLVSNPAYEQIAKTPDGSDFPSLVVGFNDTNLYPFKVVDDGFDHFTVGKNTLFVGNSLKLPWYSGDEDRTQIQMTKNAGLASFTDVGTGLIQLRVNTHVDDTPQSVYTSDGTAGRVAFRNNSTTAFFDIEWAPDGIAGEPVADWERKFSVFPSGNAHIGGSVLRMQTEDPEDYSVSCNINMDGGSSAELGWSEGSGWIQRQGCSLRTVNGQVLGLYVNSYYTGSAWATVNPAEPTSRVFLNHASGTPTLQFYAAGTGQGASGIKCFEVVGGSSPSAEIRADTVTFKNTQTTSYALEAGPTTGDNNLRNSSFWSLVRSSRGGIGIGLDGILPTDGTGSANTNAYDIGSNNNRWRNIYLNNQPNVSSDERLKRDIENSDLGLDFITRLTPRKFRMKEGTNDLHYGFIAQEVFPLVGEETSIALHHEGLIGEDGEALPDDWSMAYTELIAPLVKAVQELTARIEALEP